MSDICPHRLRQMMKFDFWKKLASTNYTAKY